MKHSITYTVFTAVNLLTFLIVTACLPAQVPVHLKEGLVDRLGSPWQFSALPAVSALISVALFVIDLRMKRGRHIASAAAVTVGTVFACIGWAFLGLAAQGAAFGERASFPYAVLTALPLSILLLVLGELLPAAEPIGPLSPFSPKHVPWEKAARVGRIVFMAAGLIGAVLSIVLSCNFKAQYDYAAIAVFVLLALLAAIGLSLYARLKRAK